jgi:hypothetical protein
MRKYENKIRNFVWYNSANPAASNEPSLLILQRTFQHLILESYLWPLELFRLFFVRQTQITDF